MLGEKGFRCMTVESSKIVKAPEEFFDMTARILMIVSCSLDLSKEV